MASVLWPGTPYKAGQVIDRLDLDDLGESAAPQPFDHGAVADEQEMGVELRPCLEAPSAVSVEIAFLLKAIYPLLDLGDRLAGHTLRCRQIPELASPR